ncbi:MAG: 8-amino-7-oxononanoate synthase [bacterium]|nr:8-amino-7-oxononanoate synthase [bacterium]
MSLEPDALSADNHRTCTPTQRRGGAFIERQGRTLIDFSANDYLGLSTHPELAQVMAEAALEYGTGSTGSRLVSGDRAITHHLEAELAASMGAESALVFNSGYQMNVSLIPAIVGKGDLVIADKFVHASLIDGIRLSGAKLLRYRHNDMGHLEARLQSAKHSFSRVLIVTESVFSMEGDSAPISELIALKSMYNCELLIDEAHAWGVFGPNGMGLIAKEGVQNQCDYITATFGKSAGSAGAFVACSKERKNQLINTCRGFIYSTALPLPVIAVNRAALTKIKSMNCERETLIQTADQIRNTLSTAGFQTRGNSPIIPIILGENRTVLEAQSKLALAGCNVIAMRPPTVPDGEARLRIVITTHHTQAHIQTLIEAL